MTRYRDAITPSTTYRYACIAAPDRGDVERAAEMLAEGAEAQGQHVTIGLLQQLQSGLWSVDIRWEAAADAS